MNKNLSIPIMLDQLATASNYTEAGYLAVNADVAAAIEAGHLINGRAHSEDYAAAERRMVRVKSSDAIGAPQARKLTRIKPLFRKDLPYQLRGRKRDYLTDALREETGVGRSVGISANGYDAYAEMLIAELRDGLLLDCGAGKRNTYHENVVKFEIFDFDTTDVIGVGEEIPFIAVSFDAVTSIAVLEHVRDPFRCEKEVSCVLKPGGRLLCSVPFLQSEHRYPHHYYNMAPQGLKALFERDLIIDDHKVIDPIGPVWALRWILESWRSGLAGPLQDAFLQLRVADVLATEDPDRAP